MFNLWHNYVILHVIQNWEMVWSIVCMGSDWRNCQLFITVTNISFAVV